MSIDINPVSNTLNAVGKVVDVGANAVEKVAGVFTTNKERDAQRSSEEQMALLNAYQAEFANRQNRTWIDSFTDSFNRLIRPFIVTIIVSIFIIAYFSPVHFGLITTAMHSVPNGYWGLLSVIVGFYFGGRMQLKSQDFQFKKSQLQAVGALIEAKKEFRKLEMDTDEPDRLIGEKLGKEDKTADLKRNQQKNGVIAKYLAVKDKQETDQGVELKKTIDDIYKATEGDNPYICDF